MSEIRLIRQHIVKLQEEITKVKKSPTYVMSFVTNDTIPQQLQRNTVYYNLSNDEILVWNDFTNEWFMLSGGGSGVLSFEELSSMIIAGEGITLSVDSEQQTITFNNDFEGMTTVTYIRRSDYISADRISYLAFAPTGSLETDAVWTITKRVGSADGTIVSNVQYVNKKWTERGLL